MYGCATINILKITMIRTRFAPSPTGRLHVGGLRTALYAWAYARHHGGQFVLRIEDTDTQRNSEEASAGILTSMKWAGLDWDEGPIYQTDRFERYGDVAKILLEKGLAYYSTDTQPHDVKDGKYRGTERDLSNSTPPDGPYVVRAKIPFGVDISYTDMVKGLVQTRSDEVEDWVLVRSNGTPTYNFAVVVDDMDMNITHVIRGDDHVNNTPKQWLLYQSLGATAPIFGHIPMILDAQGKKLSKRTIDKVALTQAFPVDVDSARAQGLTPVALLNYLARLGWSKGNMEVFDVSTFVSVFDGLGMQSSAARVDPAKLHWLNVQHLKNLSNDDLYTWSIQQENVVDSPLFQANLPAFADLLRQRSDKTSSFVRDFVFVSNFLAKTKSFNAQHAQTDVVQASWPRTLHHLAHQPWTAEGIEQALRAAADDTGFGFGDVAKSFRLALSDEKSTPPIPMLFLALGPTLTSMYMAESIASVQSLSSPQP